MAPETVIQFTRGAEVPAEAWAAILNRLPCSLDAAIEHPTAAVYVEHDAAHLVACGIVYHIENGPYSPALVIEAPLGVEVQYVG